MFTKYDSPPNLASFRVGRVGDIRATGVDAELLVTSRAIRTFRAGDIGKLPLKTPIIFNGVLIESTGTSPWDILLSRIHYASELKKAQLSDYVSQGRIVGAHKLRTVIRQVPGSLIRLRLSRPDIGYDITKTATDVAPFCQDTVVALQSLPLYNKVVRYVQNYNRGILYSATSSSISDSFRARLAKFRQLRLVFSEDGFGALSQSRSIGGLATVFADVLALDGATFPRTTDRPSARKDPTCLQIANRF